MKDVRSQGGSLVRTRGRGSSDVNVRTFGLKA